MYSGLLADARLHRILEGMDEDLASSVRADGCLDCGGVLHSARFRRKPRGMPAELIRHECGG
jgi:hypothetical protein